MKASFWICLTLVMSAAGMQSAALAQNGMPEIRFPEADQTKASARAARASAGPPQAPGPQAGDEPRSSADWLHPTPHHWRTVRSGGSSLADQLNRAELNYLLGRSRGARRASIR